MNAAHCEVAQALRELIESSMTLTASDEELLTLAAQLRSLNQGIADKVADQKPYSTFNLRTNEFGAMLPSSPVSGPLNPIAPPVQVRHEDDQIIGDVTFGHTHEGPPGTVHGALICAVYDQVLAFACVAQGLGGPTANIRIEFHKATKLHTPTRFLARVSRQEGRKISVIGECYQNGKLVTSCEGLFIQFVG